MNKFIHNIKHNNTIIDIKDSLIAIAALIVISIVAIAMLIKEIVMYIIINIVKYKDTLMYITILTLIFTITYIITWLGWIMCIW